MTIDNSKSKLDLAALFGSKKPGKRQDEDHKPRKPEQEGEYEYEWGRGQWLSVLNDALFTQGDD
jgi:hypothetical protein